MPIARLDDAGRSRRVLPSSGPGAGSVRARHRPLLTSPTLVELLGGDLVVVRRLVVEVHAVECVAQGPLELAYSIFVLALQVSGTQETKKILLT